MSVAEKFISEFNGEKYLGFKLSKLKAVDQFGKTHTALSYIPDYTKK